MNVNHDESNVVVLSHAMRLPSANLGHQFVCYFRGPGVLRAENNRFKLRVPKWFTFRIFGLKHTVCVQQKTVAGADRYVANRIFRRTCHTENQTVAFDTLQSPRA